MLDVPTQLLPVEKLNNFVISVFVSLGLSHSDAEICSDILISADKRNIPSHGVARLWLYVDGIRRGYMKKDVQIEILRETPGTLLIDAHDGIGMVVSYKAMKMVIEKAKKFGVAVATVRKSNHFGIAGYYAMMALPHDLIGISLTNTSPVVVPTFASSSTIGTNPIAVAVPTNSELPWVLDMATSTVPLGKLEVYSRQGKKVPLFWAADETGRPTDNPNLALNNYFKRGAGGLLPLGGADEITGGHKGYGLAVLVDILSGVLSGGAFANAVYGYGDGNPPNVCHFFAAIDPQAFLPIEQFKSSMDKLIKILHNSPKSAGQEKIWVHGEKEWLAEKEHSEFVPVEEKVIEDMQRIAKELGVNYSL